jgi:radical SAM protein with 4Fe4S-binding SPASM domain
VRRTVRKEKFGFIVQPPLTKSLVYLARSGRACERPLSAPVEAHLSITSSCPNRCSHCYESSSPDGSDLGLATWKGVVDALARMGVFHCAIGGGEPAAVPWLFEIAQHARRKGLVPNLTTSGAGVTREWATRSEVFGQVNVSIDGPEGPRGRAVHEQAVRAAEILRRHRGNVGVNCVLTRDNFSQLDAICAFAKRLGLSEIEFLRFKPAGRAGANRGVVNGVAAFGQADLTSEMYAEVVPTMLHLLLKYRLRIKLDCSFVPTVASAGIKPEIMRLFGAAGCEGGNELCAVDAGTAVRGCSFDAQADCLAADIETQWPLETSFVRFRRWEREGSSVCLDCDWFEICRGGCHVVARHVAGSWYAPDPSCSLAANRKA